MSNRATTKVDSTASSSTREGLASALKQHVDLSLVAEEASLNRAHSKTTVAHSKTDTGGQRRPKLSSAQRQRALRLAKSLASSRSD